MMELDLATARAQYPQPIREQDRDPTDATQYCVGGALCLTALTVGIWFDVDDPYFPAEDELASLLLALNPALEAKKGSRFVETQAMAYADAMIVANEAGHFDKAWRLAEEAVAWRRGGARTEARYEPVS